MVLSGGKYTIKMATKFEIMNKNDCIYDDHDRHFAK